MCSHSGARSFKVSPFAPRSFEISVVVANDARYKISEVNYEESDS